MRRFAHRLGRFARGGCAAAALAALCLAPAPATASTVVEGVRFERSVGEGASALDLCSAELLRWKYVFKVYVAALYVDDCGALPEAIDRDVPRRLELSYLRGFSAEQFAKAADTVLRRTHDEQALAPLKSRIERLHAAYRSVSEGDRYALTYRPGQGTELALNGERLVLVEGADFADAYFDIWLGPDPADEGLRDRLLQIED
jgi:hypothetical protein